MLWDTHKDNIRFHGSEHFIEKQKQNSFAFVNVSQHILNAFPNYNNKTWKHSIWAHISKLCRHIVAPNKVLFQPKIIDIFLISPQK